METKEFSELDNLKKSFIAAGLDVQMSKDGIKLIKSPKFNSSKLEEFLWNVKEFTCMILLLEMGSKLKV